MIIEGAVVEWRAAARAASASSSRRSPLPRLPRTLLHRDPALSYPNHFRLASRVSRSRPDAHLLQRVQRRERLPDGSLGPRSFFGPSSGRALGGSSVPRQESLDVPRAHQKIALHVDLVAVESAPPNVTPAASLPVRWSSREG